jgi:hypothetical protein
MTSHVRGTHRCGDAIITVPGGLGGNYGSTPVRHTSITVNPAQVNTGVDGQLTYANNPNLPTQGITKAQNEGNGAHVYDSVQGVTIKFRTICAGPGINVTTDSPTAGCITVSAIPTNSPSYISLFVNGVTGDDNNPGTAQAPIQTITQALFIVKNQGWDITATITIQSSTPAYQFTNGLLNISGGARGFQAFPLVLQGDARTHVGGPFNIQLTPVPSPNSIPGGWIDQNTNMQGSQILTISPNAATGGQPGQIVRFITGNLSQYSPVNAPSIVQNAEAFIGAVGNGAGNNLTLGWTSLGSSTTPAMNDTFVIEDISTQVQLPQGSSSISANGHQFVLYNLEFMGAIGGSQLVINDTELFTNAVRITAAANSTLDIMTSGGALTISSLLNSVSPVSYNLPTLPLAAPNSTAGACFNARAVGSEVSFTSSQMQNGLSGMVGLGHVSADNVFQLFSGYFVAGGNPGPNIRVNNGGSMANVWTFGSLAGTPPVTYGGSLPGSATLDQLHVSSPLDRCLDIDGASNIIMMNSVLNNLSTAADGSAGINVGSNIPAIANLINVSITGAIGNGIDINGGQSDMLNVTITGCGGNGIVATNAATLTGTNVTVSGNAGTGIVLTGNCTANLTTPSIGGATAGAGNSAGGIVLDTQSSLTLFGTTPPNVNTANIVNNSTTVPLQGSALDLKNQSRAQITNTTIMLNSGKTNVNAGIAANAVDSNSQIEIIDSYVGGNTAEDANSGNGISLSHMSRAVITNTQIGSGDGLSVNQANGIIMKQGSVCDANGVTGINGTNFYGASVSSGSKLLGNTSTTTVTGGLGNIAFPASTLTTPSMWSGSNLNDYSAVAPQNVEYTAY